MQVEYVPSLLRQRALYDIPRGLARFEAYTASMLNAQRDGIDWPFAALNPMGKQHVPAHYEALLAFDAEAIAQQTLAEIQADFPPLDVALRMTLVVVDDLMGGWTQQHFTDWDYRFNLMPNPKNTWLPVYSWTSSVPTPALIAQSIRAVLYRAAYCLIHGEARNLAEMLRQEGAVTRFAGQVLPLYEPEELNYIRELIAEHHQSTHQPTQFAVFYGDQIAATVGYPSLGLSAYAGLVVATIDAPPNPISLLTP
ncbi:MAG: hypothetical protein LCH85_03640 [Chloroflexi bacterium]|nr:hypothetical protein [Chloroflexota bacterium]